MMRDLELRHQHRRVRTAGGQASDPTDQSDSARLVSVSGAPAIEVVTLSVAASPEGRGMGGDEIVKRRAGPSFSFSSLGEEYPVPQEPGEEGLHLRRHHGALVRPGAWLPLRGHRRTGPVAETVDAAPP